MRIWRYLAPVAALAAFRGLAAAQGVQLPNQPTPRVQLPGFTVPTVGFPVRVPHRGTPVVRLPQIGLPKPLRPTLPVAAIPTHRTLPVARVAPTADVRAMTVARELRRRSLGPGLTSADLSKTFENSGAKTPQPVPVADPSAEPAEPETTPSAPESRSDKSLTLPEWDLENEIGLP